MGMGLQGAGAVASLQAMLRARLLAEQQAKQQGFENSLKVSADQRANRSLDEQTAQRKLAEADRVANEHASQQDHANDNARGVATLYAPGDVLPSPDAAALKGGNLGGLVSHQDATLPSTQYDGVSTLPGGPKPITGSLSMIAKAGNPEQDVFKGTSAQRAAAAKAPDAEPLVEVNQGGRPIYTRRSEAIGKPAYVKPEKDPTNSFQLQPEIDPHTGQQTGRFLGYNTKTNSWEPVKGQGPGATKAPPGAAQTANDERHKKDALDTLGQLDQSIDAAKDLIGPGAGRVSSLEQMIGNPDPRIQALGAKMQLAKMRIDAGIGGARAAASPQLLARWDKLLGNNINYADLKAATQAIREVLGGGSLAVTGGAVSMVAPDGRRLSVPADKVAELEAHGAKRVP